VINEPEKTLKTRTTSDTGQAYSEKCGVKLEDIPEHATTPEPARTPKSVITPEPTRNLKCVMTSGHSRTPPKCAMTVLNVKEISEDEAEQLNIIGDSPMKSKLNNCQIFSIEGQEYESRKQWTSGL
jgi:hypothetical protein